MTKDLIQFADAAMFEAQPMLKEGTRVEPRVFLLSATPDPLGNLAADMRMYRGDPVYDLSEITDEERRWAWSELGKTHIDTPLEGVTLKFMIEGVTRSFTHQMVRQRVGAYFAQESLRFAVKRGFAQEMALPPSIVDMSKYEGDEHLTPSMQEAMSVYKTWQDTAETIEAAYNKLVDAGIPAEDARGLLPHATTTRILYTTNLRGLFAHAGNRLCTQAQFEWRAVFMEIIKSIAKVDYTFRGAYGAEQDGWQWKLIARPAPHSFTPVCYRLGKCAFMGTIDRACTIRERVNEGRFDQIKPEEWLANPWAGTTHDNSDRPA